MNLTLETEFSKAEILQEVKVLKKQIDELRPLPGDVEGKVMQKLRLDWNYHSNAIEGNRLSYGETVAFLMEGITAKGKPLKDHLDIRGHNEAINFLLSIVKDPRPFSESDIRNLHQMILVEPYNVKAQTTDGLPTTKRITLGEYKTLPNHVKTATGETHYYATPEETPARMQELMEWFIAAAGIAEIHPVVLAALFHHKFVVIHPFDDGNGRLSRLLMNLILMQKGYPPVVIKMDDRQNYYSLLSRADNGESWPFVEYISNLFEISINIYLRAATGNDIDDEDDVDKELLLFKNEVQSTLSNKKEIDSKGIYDIIVLELLPVIRTIVKKATTLEDLFVDRQYSLLVTYTNIVKNLKDTHSTLIGKQDVGQFFSFFSNEIYKIESIALDVQLMNFKDESNMFDVTGSLVVSFNKYEYRITNHNRNLNFIKSYNDKLSKENETLIVATVLKDLKHLIEDNLN